MKKMLLPLILAVLLSACTDSTTSSDSAREAASAAAEAEAAANAAVAAASPESKPRRLTPEEDKQGKEMIALLLNLNSLLCAEVVEVNPLKVRPGVLEVKCIEYRGGTATKNYIVDTNDGSAFPQ